MPLDQLMAKYGYTANTDAANPSETPLSHPAHAQSSPSSTPMDTDQPPPPPSPPALPQSPAKPRPSRGKSKAALLASNTSDGHKPTAAAALGIDTDEAQQPEPAAAAAAKGKAVEAAETQQQAEQATAAGMDAFEHSQALAERRASGAQAGPSSASASVLGKAPDVMLPDTDGHSQAVNNSMVSVLGMWQRYA